MPVKVQDWPTYRIVGAKVSLLLDELRQVIVDYITWNLFADDESTVFEWLAGLKLVVIQYHILVAVRTRVVKGVSSRTASSSNSHNRESTAA